jgi:hypothetical protein
MLHMVVGGSAAESRAHQLQQLGDLEHTLATCARLAAGDPAFRDVIDRMGRQFAALSRSVQRSATRAGVSRDVELASVYARYTATTVSQAARELRAEARMAPTATTTVSSGLRRVAAAENAGPLPRGGHVAERVCSDCGEGFGSSMGARRCEVCAERREKRRQDDLERARTRLLPTMLSDGWAQVCEEEAKTMRRILRRGDR